MSKGNVHCLIGIHTAGKSTLGEKLIEHGFAFLQEMAMHIVREHGYCKMPWEFEARFDEEVIISELRRDDLIFTQSQDVFVETWHIGNLAYARLRSPDIAIKYQNQIMSHIQKANPLVYFLNAPASVIQTRSMQFYGTDRQQEALNFYSRICEELLAVCASLDIIPVKIDASNNIESVLNDILQHETSHCLVDPR